VETPAATPTPPPVSSEVTSESSSEASSETSSETDSAVSAESSAPSSSEDPSSSEISSESSSVPESSSSAPSSSEESSAPEESRGEELSPIEQAVATATDKRHLQLSETPHTSEEAANRYFYDMVYSNYVDFGVFVTKPVFAHTAEEYAELFPGLDSITMTEAAVYSNGYYFRFHLSRNINFALKTALVSGNTAYLTETERLAYDNLWSVLDSCIQSDMSNTARVMAIHDHIVAHTTYGSSGNAYTAVGVLVDRKAVCDGYSKAFQLFMDALGIPCVRFTGTAGGVSHAWNAVQLNGCWYHVDTTWDDPVPDTGGVSYEYFLVTDSILQQTHSWSASIACTDESIEVCLDAGTKTFFRLGQTIEHQIKKHHTLPPKDYKKWAVIAEHIIRHCTEGWAEGHNYDMPYWEIWNEPDLNETEENKRNKNPTLHLRPCFRV